MMPKRTSLMLLMFSALLAVSACTKHANSDESNKDKDKKEVVSLPVEVKPAVRGDIAATLTSTSTLEAEEHAVVVAKVSGIAMKLFAEEGQVVKAGEPLVQLDTEKLQLEKERAEINLKKLESDLERTRQLFAKNLISSDIYDKLKFDYEAQKAAYELVKLELTNATVRAPIGGVVSKRMVKVGNMVTLHQAVYEITDFDPLLAVVHVPERDIPKLKRQLPAVVAVDAHPGKVFAASILRISPVVDAATGTFKVTLAVADKENLLKPGMFGRVAITYAQHQNTVLVAKESVLNEDGRTSLFVIKDNTAYRTPVEVGFVDDQHAEILAGVEHEQLIVTTGQNSLKHEAKVAITNSL